MLFSNELVLIKQEYGFDELKNHIATETRTEVFCNTKSITRQEFYLANTVGTLKPSLTFVIHLFEYNNEELVEYEGQRYRVIRTYINSLDTIELVCEKVVADEN